MTEVTMSLPDKKLGGGVLADEKHKIAEPPLYKVLLHNDDYTTMDFVVTILETVFHKDRGEATKIMMNVHQQGIGIAGIYTREIADTKIHIVHDLAQRNEFPLKCSMELA